MTGDAPQPGETPRTEGNPWSFDPDAAWWRGERDRAQTEAMAEAAARPRHPRRRPAASAAPTALPPAHDDSAPAFAPEALDAHAAGAHDTARAMAGDDTPADPATATDADPGTGAETVATDTAAEKDPAVADGDAVQDEAAAVEADTAETTPTAVERDHDERTRARYNPPAKGEADVPEIMLLPEKNRSRPTVPLERGPVPGQSSGTARPGRLSPAELDVKRSRMENSPFWLNEEERTGSAAQNPAGTAEAAPSADPRPARPARRRPREPRAAAPGLFGLIALALIAAFFSWVSAEPFWLAVGHGRAGEAMVARCTGSGVTQRCAGTFAAADGSYATGPVTLLGISGAGREPGTVAPARMVNPGSKQAYVGRSGTLLQLRWVLGFLLVLCCGLGIAGLTGTRQLETVRARRVALLMSLAGPLLLLAGFLFVTY